jgi:hypothetical protein
MPSVIKKFMGAGIGGALSYYIVNAVLDEVITGTTAAENIMGTIVPLVIAAGVVWMIVSYAFSE